MHKLYKHFWSWIIALFIVFSAQAQTFSPHSQFGIGNTYSPLFSGNKGIGGLSGGFRTLRDINYLNPASYSAIQYTTFDIGGHIYGNVVSDTARIADAANGGIHHIAIAFPVMMNRWSMSVGLLPYSYKKYSFSQEIEEDGVDYSFTNSGSGSTYQLYWGNGVKIKNFSVGLNTSFLFGTLDQTENIIFNDTISALNTVKHNELKLKDVQFNFGVQYTAKINKLENTDKDKQNIYMTIGAYGAPSFKIRSFHSTYTNSSLTNIFTGIETPIDTATNSSLDVKTQTTLPFYFGSGVTFGNELTWLTGVDFHFENWKNSNTVFDNVTLGNEWKVKIGGQILPDYKSTKYGKNIVYRIGANLGKSRVIAANKGVPEFGMTFGLGLPFGKITSNNRSLSNLNIAFELGRRGTQNNESFKENYYKVTFSYTLSDRWFIKRKFD